MATHSSILAWRMSCTEDPGELYSPKDHKEWDMTKVTERVHMYMCVYMCVYMRVYMCVYMCVYVCVYVCVSSRFVSS